MLPFNYKLKFIFAKFMRKFLNDEVDYGLQITSLYCILTSLKNGRKIFEMFDILLIAYGQSIYKHVLDSDFT